MSAVYEIVEDNWANGMTSFYIKKDGLILYSTQLGGKVNSFHTLSEAREQLEKLKFKPSQKVVYTEEF